MENSQSTSSVIAKLMGLDESPPHQQPVSRQQSVLSDNYLQKSSSIGKRSRTYSQNNLQGFKKRVNRRTNDSELKDRASRSLANVQHASRPSFLLESDTTFAWQAKKQLLERYKRTRDCQVRQSMFSLNNTKSVSIIGSSIGISSNEGRKYESTSKLPVFRRLNFSSSLTKKSVKTTTSDVKRISRKVMDIMHTNTKNNHLISNSSNPSFVSSSADAKTEDGESFSSEQDSTIRSLEDGKVEAYQHSPNSVLEAPFREDNSFSSEYCQSSSNDLRDLWMEDDFGPEMATSSDDERSCTGQTLRSTIPFEAKESRDFSYLVDVLDESGFQDGNVEIRFEKWHSSECMASQSIFETLEKKYGQQELWHKSERKLLFDRINSGTIEIFRPRIDIRVCPNPLQRKMRRMWRRDVIEEELSTFLLCQEKGVNDTVSEKAVGREPWFDPADDLDSLIKEIEIYLFDELTAELLNDF